MVTKMNNKQNKNNIQLGHIQNQPERFHCSWQDLLSNYALRKIHVFFKKQHFDKQLYAEIGKKLSKSKATP